MPDDAPILPSILDRLLDESAVAARDRPQSRWQTIAELRDAIRRDLEALLNTHRCCRTPPETMTELERSLLRYGVPDFLSVNAGAAAVREEFRVAVEQTVRRFEPRFKSVTVTLIEDDVASDRVLRFRIDALMQAEPAPEPVSFDSHLDPSNQSVFVAGDHNG